MTEATFVAGKAFRIALKPAERLMLRICVLVLTFDVFLYALRGGEIAFPIYALLLGVAAALVVGGQYYRLSGRSSSIADALMCTAIVVVFSNAFVVFNYLLLPLYKPVIDPTLIRIDAVLGFHWPDIVSFAANNPLLNQIIKTAYLSTMPQITLLVVLLGLSGRIVQLHTLILTIMVTSVGVVLIWVLVPTAGPMAFLPLDKEVVTLARPVLDNAYGDDLRRLIERGPVGLIAPSNVKGLVSFPSYHTTLACICMYCAFGMRWMFPIFAVVNLLILPGTLMHGGHHLVDVIAGFALFFVGLWVVKRLDLSKSSG